jgi:hypothetical protein
MGFSRIPRERKVPLQKQDRQNRTGRAEQAAQNNRAQDDSRDRTTRVVLSGKETRLPGQDSHDSRDRQNRTGKAEQAEENFIKDNS